MEVSNMSSVRSTIQHVTSINNKVEAAPRSGVTAKGTGGSVGKYSPPTAMQKSKIPTNIAQSGRAGVPVPAAHPGDSSKQQTVLEDSSRNVNTSRISPGRRSMSKNVSNPTSLSSPRARTSNATTNSSPTKRRLLENQYALKKKRYEVLKKELTEKEKTAHEIYNEMVQLRDKVIASGAKDPGRIEEIDRLRADRADDAGLINTHPGGSGERSHVINSVASEFVETIENKFQEIPGALSELCREMLANRTEIITWMTNLNYEEYPDPDVVEQFESYRREGASLQTRLEETSRAQQGLMADLIQKIRVFWETRCAYGDRLEGAEDGMQSEPLDKLDAKCEETNVLKERVNSSNVELQIARKKIGELECLVVNGETKIRQLQENIETLEAQTRQRTLRKSEGPVGRMEKQRDGLELRSNDTKKLTSKELEAEGATKEIMQQLEQLSLELKEEKDRRQQVEAELSEVQDRYKKLEERSQQLREFAEKTDFPGADEGNTDKEERLFNELQATRITLSKQEEKIVQLQLEKEEIVAVLHRVSQAGGGARLGVHDKLAAELATKTNEFHSLIREHAWLQKNYEIALGKNDDLEQRLADLHGNLHAQPKEDTTGRSTSEQVELHQQISNLRSELANLMRRNEELETTLNQKQLELEQRDRVMREQSKVLKVRDELIGLLKGKGRLTNGETMNFQSVVNGKNRDADEANEIAARAEELQELYSTLENKQMQVIQLEKMVKQMEDQQDRAQAQRTRLEHRIAKLELELQEKNKDHRSRRFGFV